MIRVFVGYDPREAAAYHVFCQSVIDHASMPVEFIPLHRPMLAGFDGQRDGTNAFIFSRFLVPSLMEFSNEWAAFFDGDMLMRADIADLWALRDPTMALMVVPHDYRTRHPRKYLGTPMESANVDYPKKNQSSVMLWNCGHYANRLLTREFVREAPGHFLHRFEWLQDAQVGALPETWNRLVREQPSTPQDCLRHHTLGTPGIEHYAGDDPEWHETLLAALRIEGQNPADMIKRAQWQSSAATTR